MTSASKVSVVTFNAMCPSVSVFVVLVQT
jgi:hypothetical protein